MSDQEKKDLLQQIDQALEGIRPHLASDGGDIELVDLTEEMIVQIKWLGNCQSCSMSSMTMRAGIEQAIIGKIPGVKGVEALNGLEV
ncbi:MAG: NifU family protein [Bacteroidota bacterium]